MTLIIRESLRDTALLPSHGLQKEGRRKMKVILATYGSRGDVQPLLALALALKDAGHETLLCAPPEHADWVESYGCPFHALGSNIKAFSENFSDPNSIRAIITMIRFMRRELEVQFAQLPAIIEGADLVLGASLILGAPTVSESLDVPYRFVSFCPQILSSSQHPSLHIRNHNLPRWLNRLSWWLTNKADNFNFKKIVNRERRRLGLKPVRDGWRHLLGSHVVVASDQILGAVPRDVEQDYAQIGYFHLHQKGELSGDLQTFLASGPPPVYVGFGSMPSKDPEATTRLVMEAARSVGERVVLSRGWAELGHMAIEEDCYVVDNVPHMLLFPRVAAVVHHGGSGTTATAAWAGVPQIIVPHMLDQYYWASQIHRVGLGPKAIRRSRLTVESLSAAIRECLTNGTMRQHAQEVAAILRGQDSLREAVRLVESVGEEMVSGLR